MAWTTIEEIQRKSWEEWLERGEDEEVVSSVCAELGDFGAAQYNLSLTQTLDYFEDGTPMVAPSSPHWPVGEGEGSSWHGGCFLGYAASEGEGSPCSAFFFVPSDKTAFGGNAGAEYYFQNDEGAAASAAPAPPAEPTIRIEEAAAVDSDMLSGGAGSDDRQWPPLPPPSTRTTLGGREQRGAQVEAARSVQAAIANSGLLLVPPRASALNEDVRRMAERAMASEAGAEEALAWLRDVSSEYAAVLARKLDWRAVEHPLAHRVAMRLLSRLSRPCLLSMAKSFSKRLACVVANRLSLRFVCRLQELGGEAAARIFEEACQEEKRADVRDGIRAAFASWASNSTKQQRTAAAAAAATSTASEERYEVQQDAAPFGATPKEARRSSRYKPRRYRYAF